MATDHTNKQLSRWFFLILVAVIFYLFWQIIQPFAVVLLTAGIAAIVLAPVEPHLRKFVKYEKLSALLIVLGVFLGIVIPLFFVGLLMIEQASDLLSASIGSNGFLTNFTWEALPGFNQLPEYVRAEVDGLSFGGLASSIAQWAFENLGTLFSSTAQMLFNVIIFFIALYYLLVDRKKIKKELEVISPFKDELDADIMQRMVHTVRDVVFGALIVGIVQGTFAAIGMTIFGVPGALIWGALTVIAAEIPILGVGAVLGPAIAYLYFTGDPSAALGFTVWSAVVVGLVDNILSPLLIKGKTHMHALLILISILGGLQVFGSIGFIVGPTILAAVMVLIELYKNGILANAESTE
jgi:predicted PurR-regulated permease PerM